MEYGRGEVVIFQRTSITGSEYLIKRVIALPKERIVIKNRKITIFNKEYPKGLAVDESRYTPRTTRDVPIDVTLKSNEYFVLGDNRPISKDSEIFGPIERESIVGRLVFRFFPLERMSFFQ